MSLLTDLLAEDLEVVPRSGWTTHAAPGGTFSPIGILNHWDAVKGWPGVELYAANPRLGNQPSYHVVIQTDGTARLISQGYVYGAGGGDSRVYRAMRDDKIPPAPAVDKDMNGNPHFWAVCVNYWPDGDRLPDAQYQALVKVNAALCRRVGWNPYTKVNDHAGWTIRKSDISGRHQPPPRGWSLKQFREDVARALEPTVEKIPQPAWLPDEVLDRLDAAGMFPSGRPESETLDMWRTFVFFDRALKNVQAPGDVPTHSHSAEVRLT